MRKTIEGLEKYIQALTAAREHFQKDDERVLAKALDRTVEASHRLYLLFVAEWRRNGSEDDVAADPRQFRKPSISHTGGMAEALATMAGHFRDLAIAMTGTIASEVAEAILDLSEAMDKSADEFVAHRRASDKALKAQFALEGRRKPSVLREPRRYTGNRHIMILDSGEAFSRQRVGA